MTKLVFITAIAVLAGCSAAILGGPSTQTITHDCPLVPGRRCPTGYDCPSPMFPNAPCEATETVDIGDPNAGTSGVFGLHNHIDCRVDGGPIPAWCARDAGRD